MEIINKKCCRLDHFITGPHCTLQAEPWFDIKTIFSGIVIPIIETVRPSQLYAGNSYDGMTASLYLILVISILLNVMNRIASKCAIWFTLEPYRID